MTWLSCCIAMLLVPDTWAARVVHKERSLYRNILVQDDARERCLLFTQQRLQRNQTCMNLDHPERIVFPYVRMTFAGLLLVPDPRRILIVGLGGGTLTTALGEQFPDARIDTVEIDEAVLQVALDWFDFHATANTPVHVRDARVFVKRAIASGTEPWDLVILDAFNGEYVPEHLMTREFLEEVRAVLAPGGVVVANTFATSKLYDHESATWASVFGKFINLKLRTTSNRVILATTGALPDAELLRARADALAPALAPRGVDLHEYLNVLHARPDWDPKARVLTDQYAPANLLQGD